MPTPNSDNNPLDALIAEYLEAADRGDQPDRQQLINAHPEHASELKAFFANLDKIESTKLHVRPQLDPTILPQHEPKPGAIIAGRYKLLENIGEGGMGSVWVAEQQQPVKRRVAIKLVKAGMDSKQVLARFEAERQALAVMDHPNIAKVFDGGMTEQGRPYFVMEYVKGVPFTEYCDKARLSLKERLNLFIPVCQAVQHAHHKGIVHRDLKPSNILICLYDGKPVPKVIDFGLAKALHQSLTEQPIYTGHGIMVGTPLYMSPEQAEHNNLDVDTRTDIYSLGVVLYELLVGTTPLEREQLRKAAVDEVLRLIREVEPPRPSVRLSSSASLPSIAAQRSIDPRHLQKSLAGDLDWIVMKTLEKERTRRYETATSLQRDIERFLNDEAVEACPPSRSYRLRKFVQRHRMPTIAGAIILLVLIAGVTGTMWGLLQARSSERAAIASRILATKSATKAMNALTAEAEQREVAERRFIEGLLRPIGYGDTPNSAELIAFADWSALPNDRLKLKVLESALNNADNGIRIIHRRNYILQACIALSPKRRSAAIQLLSAKQRDQSATPGLRTAACWLAIELGSTDLPAICEGISFLKTLDAENRALLGTVDAQNRALLKTFIELPISRMSEDQGAVIRDAILDTLLNQIAAINDRDMYADSIACRGIAAFANDLLPSQASRGLAEMRSLFESTKSPVLMNAAANGMIALASLHPTASADGIYPSILKVLEASFPENRFYDIDTQRRIEICLTALTEVIPMLDQAEITKCWELLRSDFAGNGRGRATSDEALEKCLLALSERLTESFRRQLYDESRTLHDETPNDVLSPWFPAMASALTVDEIQALWIKTQQQLLKGRYVGERARPQCARRIRFAARRLPPEVVQQSWETWTKALWTDPYEKVQVESAGFVLAGLAHSIESQQALDSFRRSHEVYTMIPPGPVSKHNHYRRILAGLLETLSNRLTIAETALLNDAEIVGLPLGSLNVLAKKMTANQCEVLWDHEYLIMTDQNAINMSRSEIDQLMSGLTPGIPAEKCQERVPALLLMLGNASPDRRPTRIVAAIARLLDRSEGSQLSTEAAILLFDTIQSGNAKEEYRKSEFRNAMEVADAFCDAKGLAAAMSHPACIESIQERCVLRFEELVLHQGEFVFPRMPSDEGRIIHGSPKVQPDSQFHNMHDAAAWIQQNWPDFDLEATHPVIWRGGR